MAFDHLSFMIIFAGKLWSPDRNKEGILKSGG